MNYQSNKSRMKTTEAEQRNSRLSFLPPSSSQFPSAFFCLLPQKKRVFLMSFFFHKNGQSESPPCSLCLLPFFLQNALPDHSLLKCLNFSILRPPYCCLSAPLPANLSSLTNHFAHSKVACLLFLNTPHFSFLHSTGSQPQ